MKTFVKMSGWFAGIGAAVFMMPQLAGSSVYAARIIYGMTPLLSWLFWLWTLVLAVLLLYAVSSGLVGERLIPLLTGINVEADPKSFEVNALKKSFSLIMVILLFVSIFAFIRVNVHTGYKCEESESSSPCMARSDTKRILFLPGLALPGSGMSSKTLPDMKTGDMVYFVANTTPIGGKAAGGVAFLTLLFIAICRVSVMVLKNRSAVK